MQSTEGCTKIYVALLSCTVSYAYNTVHTEALDAYLYNFNSKNNQAVSLGLAAALPSRY